MKYTGKYMGVDKVVITDWDREQNDYTQIYEQLTINTDIEIIKHYLHLLNQEYPDIEFMVFKETWQDNSWSDYETIKIDWNR
jgi:hypothetical protein